MRFHYLPIFFPPQVKAAAASGTSLTALLVSIAKLNKAAEAFQTAITNNGASAPTASALAASAEAQTVDMSLINKMVASASAAAAKVRAGGLGGGLSLLHGWLHTYTRYCNYGGEITTTYKTSHFYPSLTPSRAPSPRLRQPSPRS